MFNATDLRVPVRSVRMMRKRYAREGASGKLAISGMSVAALLAALSLPPAAPAGRRDAQRPVDHPVAALTWARANCEPQLSIKPGAHLAHAEVLMRVAAELERTLTEKSITEVCGDAIAAAAPAIARRAATAAQKTAANDR